MLVVAGIDEAGYGPLVGPLCVGMTVFAVPAPADSDTPPDMWKLLAAGVCKRARPGGAGGRRGRVPVADSKELKLANSVTTTHPLVHLERGVLVFGRLVESPGEVGCDDTLFKSLGAEMSAHPCYRGAATPLPLGMSAAEVAVSANLVAGAMQRAGVRTLAMRCAVTPEDEFNRRVRESGKGGTTLHTFTLHFRHAWDRWGEEHDDAGSPRTLHVVCDRLGGRIQYEGVLRAALPEADVTTHEESPARSRYEVRQGTRRARVWFMVEGERFHLPVALASMTAKFVRELAMRRFNAHWSGIARERHGIEIKPTAGYSFDGRRWLREARHFLTHEDHEHLVRIA